MTSLWGVAFAGAAITVLVWMFAAAMASPKIQGSWEARKKNRKRNAKSGGTDSGPGVQTSSPKTKLLLFNSWRRTAAAVLISVGVIWWTGWIMMGLMFGVALLANPYLSTKNSKRQRNIEASETVEKLADSIIALVSGGRKVEQATELALESPTLEFQGSAAKIHEKMGFSFVAGLHEMRILIDHSLGDILASTLNFIATSEAAGLPGEALRGISQAASDNAAMERRILINQQEGYTSARVSVWATLLIMLSQTFIARGNYDVYDDITGQVLLFGMAIVMALGVWMTLAIARGKSSLRISFQLAR